MHNQGFLFSFFVYLLAAVVSVPIAKRIGLGSVLGYLIAGAIIGPAALHLVEGSHDVMHFSEFGVVLMLFLIGLELEPRRLWNLRGSILGLGGLQVALTIIAFSILGMLILGLSWQMALAASMVLATSSTAIVLQTLTEKKLIKTAAGSSAFSVLLFQDIAVIPFLAILPAIAYTMPEQSNSPAAAVPHHGLEALPISLRTLITIGAVVGVIFAGRYLLRPFFRYIAQTNLREMFTATALLLVIGIALLMSEVGLSAALGTFLAGVVLADSEYRIQLESDIEPFKGLLLGVFFISVGANIDFSLIAQNPYSVALLVLGLLVVKFCILFGLGKAFKLNLNQSFLFAFSLAQGGEFAFVILSFTLHYQILSASFAGLLSATVALSMVFTPILLAFNEYVIKRFTKKFEDSDSEEDRPADQIHDRHHDVILAGFGRFGHVVGRFLRTSKVKVAVLDYDSNQVDLLRQFGMQSYYGDATRLDLLVSAGAANAKLFIVAIDDMDKSLQLVDLIKENFPKLTILARAVDRIHAYELLKRGIEYVYRETFDSAIELTKDALKNIGFSQGQVNRYAHLFKMHDEASLRGMLKIYNEKGVDERKYISTVRKHIQNLEEVLRTDMERFESEEDEDWVKKPILKEDPSVT